MIGGYFGRLLGRKADKTKAELEEMKDWGSMDRAEVDELVKRLKVDTCGPGPVITVPRHVVQMFDSCGRVIALCDDGSMWELTSPSDPQLFRWQRLPDIPTVDHSASRVVPVQREPVKTGVTLSELMNQFNQGAPSLRIIMNQAMLAGYNPEIQTTPQWDIAPIVFDQSRWREICSDRDRGDSINNAILRLCGK